MASDGKYINNKFTKQSAELDLATATDPKGVRTSYPCTLSATLAPLEGPPCPGKQESCFAASLGMMSVS